MTTTRIPVPPILVSVFLLAVVGCSGASGAAAVPDGGSLDAPAVSIGARDECGNGMDDDGDGLIDEDCFCAPGENQSCFNGDYPTRLVGACRDGLQACDATGSTEFGMWGVCEGDTLPVEEVCDGAIDDDCDGAIDEDCPCTVGESRGCGVEFVTAPCTGGEQRCREDGTWSSCEGAIGPSADVCDDEVDNDCDGEVDEGCDCVPSPELCDDGVDNDCDGDIDEVGCDGPMPEECPTRDTGIVELIGSHWRVCARHMDGRLFCWGENTSGGLGVGDVALEHSPTPMLVMEGATGIYGNGELTSCATTASGVRCWGPSPTGGSEYGPTAAPWAEGASGIVDVAIGTFHWLTRRADGTVWGNGSGTSSEQTQIIDAAIALDSLVATKCVVRADASVWCWGGGQEGQTGPPGGLGFMRAEPAAIEGIDDAVDVQVGRHHVCALRPTGQVVCWGADGTRGDGDPIRGTTGDFFSASPVPVPGMTDVVRIKVGNYDTCAIRRNGELWCWGYPQQRDLPDIYVTPQKMEGVSDVIDVAIGFVPAMQGDRISGNMCVLERCGRVLCWGRNVWGNIRDSAVTPSLVPAVMTGLN